MAILMDKPGIVSSLFVVIVVVGLARTSEGTSYTVGGSAGWDLSADFGSWLQNKTFYVGDALSFQYSKYHTVNEVEKADYDACNATNALLTGSDGNTTVPLTAPGDRYFICGVITHCLGGMQLPVHVTANPSAGAPVGAPQLSPSQSSFSPQAPSPVVDESPSANSVDNLPPYRAIFGGSHRIGRGSMFLAWLCTFGVISIMHVVRP
ncbi:blue copper protein-like [Ananas comosus]|uniref:Blue copper protein-like n=1 Tax=Ananas comosus TaxID=4615 RepID=A0A6P5EV01_ANACO|nr:blue copper protein-like [Ananas comosus]